MSQSKYTASLILPQAPQNTEVRCRYIDGHHSRQWFSAGGFFGDWKQGTTGMTQADLVKVAAITIDVDAYDWEGSAERWGEDRKTRKAAMRAASEDEVIQWMKDTHFRDVVMEECDAVGLPPVPNRTIYTGHGLCLIYFVGDNIGWADAEKNEGGAWTPKHMKAVIKRFHGHNEALWWWDSSAKDVGTRLFPLPKGFHRDTGKTVRLIDSCDEQYDIKGWLDGIEKQYPGNPAPKASKRKTSVGKKAKAPTTTDSGIWSYCVHNPDEHPVLEVGEKGDGCPLCGGSGYKRICDEHYSCFSCQTQFKVIPKISLDFSGLASAAPSTHQEPSDPPGYIRLDDKGHALWPDETPDRLVNKARTGTGKTHLMEREKKAWAAPGFFHKRVIAVAPTIALAGNLADRLGIAHGEAQSKVDWRSGSFACCFASLVTKTYGLCGPNLKATYLMIDECESTLSQLVGLINDGEKARETYNILVNLCARAGKVMLADANAGPITLRFIEDVKAAQEKHEQMEVIDWDVWYTDAHKHTFEFISPTFRVNKEGVEVQVRSSDHMHKGRVFEALTNGKRLAIYIPGHDAAKGFAEAVRTRFPALNVQLRVRNNSNDQKNDLSQAGLTADVLIFNNAMNTGVSYDVVDHYDEVHLLLGRGNVSDSIHIEQAVHRIRHPKSKTFIISGTVSPVINDWRCTPEGQVKAAKAKLKVGQKATTSMKAGLSLAADWMWEDSSKRLAAIQATILASRYARGYRWAMTFLAAHHTFTTGNGVDEVTFAQETREARDEVARREAQDIASALPLDEVTMAKVEHRGADTEDEYFSYRATKLGQVFGDGFTAQDEAEKAVIAYEVKRKRLTQKARVFALSRMFDTDENKALAAEAEARLNSRSTVITAKVNLPSARILDALFHAIYTTCPLVDGRWAIDATQARKLLNAVAPMMKEAGKEMRADAYARPHRQLQTIFGLGGLSMRSRRLGPQGARVRHFWLAVSDVERMIRLTDAYVDRWKNHGKEVDISSLVA